MNTEDNKNILTNISIDKFGESTIEYEERRTQLENTKSSENHETKRFFKLTTKDGAYMHEINNQVFNFDGLTKKIPIHVSEIIPNIDKNRMHAVELDDILRLFIICDPHFNDYFEKSYSEQVEHKQTKFDLDFYAPSGRHPKFKIQINFPINDKLSEEQNIIQISYDPTITVTIPKYGNFFNPTKLNLDLPPIHNCCQKCKMTFKSNDTTGFCKRCHKVIHLQK
jgi:hypothetical protein